jgi:hypothetical protein
MQQNSVPVAPAIPPIQMEETRTILPDQKADAVNLVGFSGNRAMLKVIVGASSITGNQAVQFLGSGKMIMVKDGQSLFLSGRTFHVSIMDDGVKLSRKDMKDDVYLYADALPVQIMTAEKNGAKTGLLGKAQALQATQGASSASNSLSSGSK